MKRLNSLLMTRGRSCGNNTVPVLLPIWHLASTSWQHGAGDLIFASSCDICHGRCLSARKRGLSSSSAAAALHGALV